MIRDRVTLEAIENVCDRLSERTATLFLGAGINGGVRDNAGEPFPLGQGLSRWIARDLLSAPGLDVSLGEAAEMARYRCGEDGLNNYLYQEFSRFRPGTSHLALVQLPWDVIYTTNYDLLVEEAAGLIPGEAAGVIRPVSSTVTDLATFTEEDILYYKLHGSVDSANTVEGRLVLTRQDYRHYELHRKPLFKRLERDLLSRTFVFVGYSLRDSNFLDILQDCRDELGSRTLPVSYAVLRDFEEVEETFWREKYNVQLLKSDAAEFLNTLKDTWSDQNRSVLPLEVRQTKEYLQVDGATRFHKVAESFYQVRSSDCTGQSNAELFFRGGEPSWADIRDKIAPKRDDYWTVLDAMFPELANPGLPASAYLVTGAAGTGKSTLVRTIAYDLSDEFIVLAHIPGTPLDTRFLAPLVDEENPQRIIVLVRHAAEHVHNLGQFIDELRTKTMPVTVLLEERKNQWNAASPTIRSRLAPAEFALGSLSSTEIESILDALQRHWGCVSSVDTLRLGDKSSPERSPHAENQTAISTGIQGRSRQA
nr:SIR2 family protein [Actinomycetota bacterium]